MHGLHAFVAVCMDCMHVWLYAWTACAVAGQAALPLLLIPASSPCPCLAGINTSFILWLCCLPLVCWVSWSSLVYAATGWERLRPDPWLTISSLIAAYLMGR